jgi:phage I-like protein
MVHPFTLLQDDWVMLAPLGDHPHALGIQRFTPEFIANMANRFNGLLAKLGRLFSGAPTFEGHHDIEPDKYPNSRSYGWIMNLEARADGLWGKMTWTPEGREMLQNGAFKFISPVFLGKPIGQQNSQTVFEPIAFKSLALTNEPNLPLPPLANSKDHMNTITQILELPSEASADEICAAAQQLKNSTKTTLAKLREILQPSPDLISPERTSTLGNKLEAGLGSQILQLPADATADQILEAARALNVRVTTLENENQTLRTSASSADEQARVLTNTQTDLSNAVARADVAQTRLIGMLLDNAIRDGRVTLAQRADWQTKFEKDFAAAEMQLANQQPTLNTESKTRELGNQKNAYDTEATRRAALVGYITEQQAKGLSYDEAWSKAKVARADVFANMKPK